MSGPGESPVEVAAASDADARAWALVRAAGELRAVRRYDEALQALDLACQLSPGEGAELAVYACAIAIHCDCRDYELAVMLEGLFAERGIDLTFALACLRLYSELFAETGDERTASGATSTARSSSCSTPSGAGPRPEPRPVGAGYRRDP